MDRIGTLVYLYNAYAGTSRALLSACARDYAVRCKIKAPDFTIEKTPEGKPHFAHMPDVSFSVSHSGDYWLCAFSDIAVGADIQVCRAIDAARFSRRFYHPREIALVAQYGQEMFYALWCAKEAYAKYTGYGLARTRKIACAADENGIKKEIDGVRCEKIELPFSGYSACVCGGGGEIKLLNYTV